MNNDQLLQGLELQQIWILTKISVLKHKHFISPSAQQNNKKKIERLENELKKVDKTIQNINK